MPDEEKNYNEPAETREDLAVQSAEAEEARATLAEADAAEARAAVAAAKEGLDAEETSQRAAAARDAVLNQGDEGDEGDEGDTE